MAKTKSVPHRSPIPRVFISSTSEDLEPFRAAAREAVISAGMFPVMSDNFPASGAEPPLKVCLDKVAETDLLIVLVAHRYGWIPQDQPQKKPRKSITWLECRQAAETDQREVLGFLVGQNGEWPEQKKEEYLLTTAARERKLTAELSAHVTEALDGLDAFKNWLNGRAIRKTVEATHELVTQIVLALNDWRKRHPEFDAPAAAPGEVVMPDKYLRELLEATSFINIRGLSVGSGTAYRFPIEDLYIALKTRMGVRDPDEGATGKPRRKSAGSDDVESPERLERMIGESGEVPLQAALAERRVVVIGDPGAGKTTFLRRVAAALCATELATVPQAAQARLGISDKTFPIFLRCATLANHIAAHLGQPGVPADAASPAWLAHCLAAESLHNGMGLDQAFFQRQLEVGRCTVLLDGLDEAPNRVQRDALSQLAENVSRLFADCRFVVTSRPPAYTGDTVLPQFAHVEIAPLSDEAVDTFLTHWCRTLYGGDTPAARDHIRELLESLHARPEIRRVARNPVMLTALAVVHWNERRLPEQRAELYDSVITWLSRSREDRPGREKPEKTVTLLQELALAMQNHPEGRQTQMPKRWAAEQLAPHFGPKKPTAKSLKAAEDFLTAEELDSGIVVALGNDIRFWHLQFQEFLAARAIAGLPDTEQQTLLSGPAPKLYRPEWREVILLLAGALHKQGEAKVDGFVTQVLDSVATAEGSGVLISVLASQTKPTPSGKSGSSRKSATSGKPKQKSEHLTPTLADEARCAGLLGAVFHDLKPVGYQPHEPRYDKLLDRVMAIFDRDRSQSVKVEDRIAAAEALGQVGDPRLEHDAPGRWITIPAGTFRMGSQKTDKAQPNFDEEMRKNEGPVHDVTLDAFSIARFPVTVGEYLRFMEDDGYAKDKYWQRGGGFGKFQEPEGWSDQLAFRNRPVVSVSWYEAMAYCAWAQGRLPTEAEWERAARRTTGRKYPWGNRPTDPTLLNFDRIIGNPTPVGIYPLGATPEGIEDLVGNVWEWCHDVWDEQAYQRHGDGMEPPEVKPADAGSENLPRMLRGGSWISSAENCRASCRGRQEPYARDWTVGFRACLSPDPVPQQSVEVEPASGNGS